MHVACNHKPFQTLIHILTCMVGKNSTKTVSANYAVSIENILSLENLFDFGEGGIVNLFIWLSKTRSILDFCWEKQWFHATHALILGKINVVPKINPFLLNGRSRPNHLRSATFVTVLKKYQIYISNNLDAVLTFC